MAKATHKQIVNIFKSLGYHETKWFPCAKITVIVRPNNKKWSGGDCKTIIGSQWFDGDYDEYSNSLVDPNDMKSIHLDELLINETP